MKNYDAYLFDWDGTLVQTVEIWIASIRERLRIHNIELTDYEIARQFVGRLKPGAEEHGIKSTEIDKFYDEVVLAGKRKMLNVPLYPGVRHMIESLKRAGKKLVLLTSSHRHLFEAIIVEHELQDVFDLLVTADDVAEVKPHPEGILFALEKLNVQKSDALMVGDSEKDLEAAQNAGIDSLLFYPTSHQLFYDIDFLKQYNPKYVVEDWQKLTI